MTCWNLDVIYKQLSSEVNNYNILSLHRERQGIVGEITWRHGCWTIHCIYKQSSCRRNFYSGFDLCKSIVGVDASQIHGLSMYQAMPTGLYTKWELDSESGKFKSRQNKTKSTKVMFMSFFRRVTPPCKVETFYTTGTQKKINASSVVGFYGHCNTVFEAMGCYYSFCPCQGASSFLTEEKLGESLKREN